MSKKINRKIVGTIGSLVAVAAPLTAVISCGKVSNQGTNPEVHVFSRNDYYFSRQDFIAYLQSNSTSTGDLIRRLGDWKNGTGSIDTSKYSRNGYTFEVQNNGHLSFGVVDIKIITPASTKTVIWNKPQHDVIQVDVVNHDHSQPIIPFVVNDHHEENRKIREVINMNVSSIPRFSYALVSPNGPTGFNTLGDTRYDITTKLSQLSLLINHATAHDIAQIPALKTKINAFNDDVTTLTGIKAILDGLNGIENIQGLEHYSTTSTSIDTILADIQSKLPTNWTQNGVSLQVTAEKENRESIKIKVMATFNGKKAGRDIRYTKPHIVDADALKIEDLNNDIFSMKAQMHQISTFNFPSWITIPPFNLTTAMAQVNAKQAQAQSSHVLADVQRLHDEIEVLITNINNHEVNLDIARKIWSKLMSMNSFIDIFDAEPEITSLKPSSTTLSSDEVAIAVDKVNRYMGGHLAIKLKYLVATKQVQINYNYLGITGTKTIQLHFADAS